MHLLDIDLDCISIILSKLHIIDIIQFKLALPKSMGGQMWNVIWNRISHLDYSGFGGSVIPEFPTGLEVLDCSNCPRLDTIPALSKKLNILRKSIKKMKNMSPLPRGLKNRLLPAFPTGLKSLSIESYLGTTLPPLPKGLKVLDCSNNTELIKLPPLPDCLEVLDCSRNFDMEYLPPLPSKLEVLNCSEVGVTALPDLPSTLETLECVHNDYLTLPPLPKTLKHLLCYNANTAIENMPPLPCGLEILDIGTECGYTVDTLPDFPPGLKVLSVQGYDGTTIPPLPEGLEVLDCSRCYNLTDLPPLPKSLKKINHRYSRKLVW